MNRTHKTVFNRSLGVWQAVAETARSRSKGGSTKSAVALLLSAALATAHADVTDHGDGNFTVSGTSFTGTLPYAANGGSDSTPTITVDGTTNLTYTSLDILFAIDGPNDYTVNVAPGAFVHNTTTRQLFNSNAAGSLTTYNIAGELVDGAYVIGAKAAGAPRWDITLSGTLRNTSINTLLLGQDGADKLTLQSTGRLASAGGNVELRGGDDQFIVNGGTFSSLDRVSFDEGDDLLEFNASPTGATRMLGGNGTDTVRLNNSGSFSLTALESGWEHLVMNGTAWTLSGYTANTFSGGVALNAGTLTLDVTGGDAAITGVISGPGALTKTGSGTLTLSGSNTYTGGTTVRAGALSIAADSHLGGTVSGLVLNGGTLQATETFALNTTRSIQLGIDNGTFDVVSGKILGYGGVLANVPGYAGALTKTGSGTLTLSGTNTYTGNTKINGGTLKVDGGSTTASNNYTYVGEAMSSDGTLIIENSGTVSNERGFIAYGNSSTGAVTVTGSGSAWNTNSGSTSQNSLSVGHNGHGTLNIEDGGKVSSGTGQTTVGTLGGSTGSVTVTGSDSELNGGSELRLGYTGAGTLTVGNGGKVAVAKVTLGATISSSSTLNLDTGGVLETGWLAKGNGSATVNLDGGTLRATTGGSEFFANLAASNVALKAGGLIFDTNGHDTGTALALGDGGTGGGLTKTGTGTLTLSGANTYSGDTTISAGTLQIGNGGTTGSIAGDIVNNATLAFKRSDALTYAGVISGTGSLAKLGTGSLTLSGTHTYSGDTTLSAGTLVVNGSIASSAVTVQNGSTLAGSGTLGAVTVQGGGHIAPGNGIGTLNVAGNLTLDAGAQLDFELGSPGTSGNPAAGNSDRIVVAGDLALNGTVNLAQSSNPADGTAGIGYYRLITYGGMLTSSTASIGATPGLSNMGYTLQAGSNHVDLLVASTSTGDDSLQHWQSGNGVWNASGNSWLNQGGATPVAWAGKHAVFRDAGGFAGGTVTVQDAQSFLGLQFVDHGYRLEGSGQLVTDAAGSEIRVLADSATIATAITGSGGLTKTEAGMLVLTGNNSYTGTTTIAAGTLAVNGSIASSAVTVQNGSTLAGSGTLGAVTVQGGGRIAPGNSIGTLNVAGNLTLDAGAQLDFELGSPDTSGNPAAGNSDRIVVAGDLALNGTVNLAQSSNPADGTAGIGYYRLITYGGMLTSSTASIGVTPGLSDVDYTLQAGSNHVDLLIASTYTGDSSSPGSSIGDDSLQHWQGGHGVWNASGSQWLNLGGTTPVAWAGKHAVFRDAGSFTGGTVTVQGAQNFRGLQFVDRGYRLEGSGQLVTDAAGSEIRVLADSATIATAITGSGGLTKTEAGTLVLTGNNTYAGGTTVSAGTLQIGDGGASGSIVGNVSNHGTLAFKRSDALTFGGAISGTGRLVKEGGGTLVLTGGNSYGGGTAIAAGTLQIGDGGTSGSIVGNVSNHGTLAFKRSDALRFAGEIAGSGAIRQLGSGLLELTGDSSGFTGTTTVEAGTLAVNGRLGGGLGVGVAGRLQGAGTADNVTVSGTLAPGNSIGTLNVNSITFNAGSTYEAEVDATGQSDRIAASGTVTINGGTVRVLAGAGQYAPQTRYTLLTANGGVTGRFADVTSNLAFLDPSLGYDAGNISLTMSRNDISFAGMAGTRNQTATGRSVESLGLGHVLYNAVLNLSADQAHAAFDGLSGEIHASMQTALVEDSRFVRNAASDRLRAAQAAPGASTAPVAAYGAAAGTPRQVAANHAGPVFWAHGLGSSGKTDGDGNAAQLDRDSSGLLIGTDGQFGDWRVGVLAGYGQTRVKAAGRGASGSSRNHHLGAYAGSSWGKLALRTGAAYTWHALETRRNVAMPGHAGRLSGDYRAGTLQAFGELGYGIEADHARVEPFASLAHVRQHGGRYTEQGDAAALAGRAEANVTFSTLGIRQALQIGSGATLRGMAGWRHAFGDTTPTATHRFQGGDAFMVAGAPLAKNSAVVEAGLDFKLARHATLGVSYTGQIASGARDHGVKANLSATF